jgi:anti-sigma factor RsiW
MPLNERDWILLNAYLDGELAPGERAAFEARLAGDTALQDELDSLRQTIDLIGMAQRRPVPRSFTLDPKVYGHAKPRGALESWLVPVLGTVSAVLAAGLICGGALLAGLPLGPLAAPSEAAEYEAPMTVEVQAPEVAEAEVVEEEESAEAVEMMVEAPAEEAAPVEEVEAAPEEPLAEAAAAEAEEEPPGTSTPSPTQPEVAEGDMEQGALPPEGDGEPLDTPFGMGGGGMGGGDAGGESPPAEATARSRASQTPSPIRTLSPEELAELLSIETVEPEPPAPEEALVQPPSPPRTTRPLFGALPISGILVGKVAMGLGALLMVVTILVWMARRRR